MKHLLNLSLILKSALIAVLMTACTGNIKNNSGYDPDLQQLYIGDNIAIAQTQYGKVKGYILRGIYTYLGIPYGASTAGENRFMPPKPPESWDGVRPAVWYGDAAPQSGANFSPQSYSAFQDHWNYDEISEDCLI
jgi:para-nitrobenzyl esterase